MSKPVVSSRTPTGLIINGDGTATFAFLKWMQNIGTTVNVAFDSEGAYQGDIGDQATIVGRETLASIVQNISTDGVVQGPGIDFALPYLNKDTDHIADGSGSPLAGGKVAYAALVASGPAAGQTIRFNGTDWLPVAIAVSKVLATSQWLRSYDAATGTFTASQPAFSDVSGAATKAQLPPAIAYEDEANTFTANQTINGVLAVTGNATVGGNLGVTGNISAANFPGSGSMVYPAVGIGVSTGSAWTASIDPATVPRLNVANTFTADQAVTGNLTVSNRLQVGHGILLDEYPDAATARYQIINTTSPTTVGALTFGSYSSDFSHVLTFINCQPTVTSFMGGVASIDLAGNGHFNGSITSGAGQLATYPGAGIAVSTGSAWGTPIAAANVAMLNAANTFTAAQTINAEGLFTAGVNITTSNPPIRANSLRMSYLSGNCNIDSIGTNPTTPGGMVFRSFSSDASIGGTVISMNSGGVAVTGTLSATGAKTFVVTHPLDDTKDLIHACLEGPENGVFYRGRAKTDDSGYVTVLLPDYFEALTYIEDRTVLLTVINDGSDKFPLLKSSEVSAGGFSVRSSIPDTEFYWEVKAVRRIGVERLQVVQDKA